MGGSSFSLKYMNTLAGWMTPARQFIECRFNEHLDVVRDPAFYKHAPKLQELFDRLKEIEESCMETAEQGEHPEWHIYEIAFDRARDKAWNILLSAGFLRIAESRGQLHFEGRPWAIKKMHQGCVDLAESYAADAVFLPIKG